MATTLIPDPSDVQEIALRDALEERYLAYALSTIINRAWSARRGRRRDCGSELRRPGAREITPATLRSSANQLR